MKKSSLANEAPWTKATANKEIYNLLWQAIRNTIEKLDKLTNLTQNLQTS